MEEVLLKMEASYSKYCTGFLAGNQKMPPLTAEVGWGKGIQCELTCAVNTAG